MLGNQYRFTPNARMKLPTVSNPRFINKFLVGKVPLFGLTSVFFVLVFAHIHSSLKHLQRFQNQMATGHSLLNSIL